MGKLILLILLTTVFVSCESESTGVIESVTNNYSGDWVLDYSGDAVGAATVGVLANGKLENGIMLDSVNTGVIFRIDIFGDVEDDGTLTANLKLYGNTNTVGSMDGTFNDSPNGNYTIYYPGLITVIDTTFIDSVNMDYDTTIVANIDTLSGLWTAEYFD